MPAFLEYIPRPVYILRAGPKAVAYGDPFTASGVLDGDTIKGFTRRMDDGSGWVEMLQDTRRCVHLLGMTHFNFERYRGNGVSLVKVRV